MGEILTWSKQENVPGEFPYTAGVFPFKRKGEDPTRMFAGEGGPDVLINAFIIYLRECLLSGFLRPLIQLHSMVKTQIIGQIFMEK